MSRNIGYRDGFDETWHWLVVEDDSGRKRPRLWTLIPAIALIFGMILGAGMLLRDSGQTAAGAPLSGAIFTTTPDGGIVNENVHYDKKKEVYLDGGPPPNAPQTAAGLPDGKYVFQVTDPSGGFLLSEDPSKCRIVRVADGVIVQLVPPSTLGLGLADTYDPPGPKGPFPCHIQDAPDGVAGSSQRHDTNTDTDHGPPAIVVQLMPFADTPNPGNVYKAWVTPIEDYVGKNGDLEEIPHQVRVRGKFQGFRPDGGFGPPRDSVKTDNFKVKDVRVPPPMLHVFKCIDRNGNGVMDADDPMFTGWKVDITDPTGVKQSYYTPVWIVAEPTGDYIIDEENPAVWEHTLTKVDGTPIGVVDPVTVNVDTSDRTVTFCNFNPGTITACKFYDFDRDGSQSGALEVDLSGWPMTLNGTTFEGTPVGPDTRLTGADGCVTFSRLVEGSYTVAEGTPDEPNWVHTTATIQPVNLSPGDSATVRFGNVCVEPFAGGLTMGYWKTHTGLDSPERDPTYDQLPIMLGISPEDGYPEERVDAEAEARAVFDAAESSTDNGVLMLKAQLLAAKLNELKFPGFSAAQFISGLVVGDVMDAADQILDDIANGIAHSKQEIVSLSGLLDAANNNSHSQVLSGPSPTPCDRTFS
jgi:hypothetical protein